MQINHAKFNDVPELDRCQSSPLRLAGAQNGLRKARRLIPAELLGYLTTILRLVWLGSEVLALADHRSRDETRGRRMGHVDGCQAVAHARERWHPG
ncbi:hypothetical protein J2Z75_003430 [Rhizobium herbae]|uniref:Uncharacterized protein n=1 Tax=Rhizobium herbae TaxID=508661 RepID=A0ABS4EPN6_9HYPH|nr:hypothetical protein [Rhizobium herbae]